MGSSRAAAWVRAHEALCELSRRRAELDWLEASALLRALRANVHRHLGFGSFAEYVERLFGYGRRAVDDKLRTAMALEELPGLAQALREGAVNASAARELARVATPETEQEWLEVARGRTVHQIERMVSGHSRGAKPSDAPDSGARRHLLRFEVSAETLAHLHEAFTALRNGSGQSLDDDAVLLLMAREVLGGPADEGRASYQVAITTCDRCGRGFQQAAGELIEVESTVVEMAECDAQHLGSTDPQQTHVGSGARSTQQTHVGEARRAVQSIPPALRRKVLRRDRGRCVVPGCRHHRFVDLHHLEARADGGEHDENNLVVLCSAHHRALHRGQLTIRGSVATGLRFQHADGTVYGNNPSPRAADRNERAFRGLRSMGFPEKSVSRALEQAMSQVGAQEQGTASLIRAALAVLVPST
jgi:5-methylcytosine-specific restriction endonuclease McrA